MGEKKNSADELIAKAREKRRRQRDETLSEARIQNENARKYRDFKMYFFGRFLTKVPIFRMDRCLDLPLVTSSATPYEEKKISIGELAIEEATKHDFEVGQQLVGAMIPKIRKVPKTIAPIGQPAKNKSSIENGGLGADIGD